MVKLRSIVRSFLPAPVLRFLLPRYHWLLALAAASRYGFPSRSLIVIGVTGTDGKTSVVHLLHELLASSGYAVGSLSSLRFKIHPVATRAPRSSGPVRNPVSNGAGWGGGKNPWSSLEASAFRPGGNGVHDREEPNLLKMTMPGRFRLQQFLAECRAARCRFAIIEVTSQGIAQSRHRFTRFSGAVLTNVAPEHLEAHGSFEAYRSSKIELFRRIPADGFVVLNRHDESSAHFAAATPAQQVWYSRERITVGSHAYPVRIGNISTDHIELSIGAASARVELGGAFNVPNIIAASAVALSLGVSPQTIAAALNRVTSIPGRLEFVIRSPFSVVVDYANTPQAYGAVYQTLTERNPGLVCVFGAPGGGRDKWKRPELGKIAARYCQSVILTSDDPDDEDPSRIVSEIQSGMTNDQLLMTKVKLDRREAIREALGMARPGDTIIITGMGAQPWFVGRGGKKIPWDDRAVVREEFAALPQFRSQG